MHLWSCWAPEARTQQLDACGVYKYLKLDVNMRLGRELGQGAPLQTRDTTDVCLTGQEEKKIGSRVN